MKLTNKLNLPDVFFQAVKNDKYSMSYNGIKADYSATGLLKTPQQSGLFRLHKDEIEEDISDRIYALLGQSVHHILERADTDWRQEKRIFANVNDRLVSGQIDLFDPHEKILYDFKVCSTYADKDDNQDWKDQLSIYSALMMSEGTEVKGARIIMIFRDWSRTKAERESGYPQTPVKVREIKLHDNPMTFLKERVALHKEYEDATEFPECTKEERWATDPVFAVYKNDNKTASRLLESEDAANEWIQNQDKKHKWSIVFRPGESKRCGYCSVSSVCPQYKKENEK